MWHHRVPQGALARLERHAGKLARAVLRGLGGSNPARLPGIGETYRKATRPDPTHWNVDPDKPCLRCQPTEPETTAKTWKYGPMQYSAFVLQKATWINLSYSMSTLGSRKERTGQVENTPPTALRWSPTC